MQNLQSENVNLRNSHLKPCLKKALIYTYMHTTFASLLSGTSSYGPQETMASFSDVALTHTLFNGAIFKFMSKLPQHGPFLDFNISFVIIVVQIVSRVLFSPL